MVVFSYVKNKTRTFDLNFQLIIIKSLFGISCLKQDVTGAESKNKQQLRNMAEMKYKCLLGKNNSTWFCYFTQKTFRIEGFLWKPLV